jgi:hypothetical protein
MDDDLRQDGRFAFRFFARSGDGVGGSGEAIRKCL